jgi:hypothetical protein
VIWRPGCLDLRNVDNRANAVEVHPREVTNEFMHALKLCHEHYNSTISSVVREISRIIPVLLINSYKYLDG